MRTTARTPEQTLGRRSLRGAPAPLAARTVQSCRMRKPGPLSRLLTASASRPSQVPAARQAPLRNVTRAATPSPRQALRAIARPARRPRRMPMRRTVDHRGDQSQRHDKAGRATRDADLPPSTRDLPDARDVLPNIRLAELDGRKLSEYSLNPGHPGNNGKADGWRTLGYDVDNPDGRRDVARELRGLICDELLARGKVAETRDTAYSPAHRVLSGLTGPNGRGMPLWSPAGLSKTAQASAFPSSRRYGCSLIATRRPDDDRSEGIRPDPHDG
jgi:hypothetical protein